METPDHPQSHPHATLRGAFSADIAGLEWSRVALLLAFPVLVAFEWGAGNDFVNVVAIANAYASSEGLAAIGLAAAVGFAVPFLTQLTTGSVAAYSLPSLAQTGRFLYRRAAERHHHIEGASYRRLARVDRWIISVGVGTSAAVLLEQSTTAHSGLREMRSVLFESAFFMAATTAVVSAATTGLLELGRLHPAIEPIVDPAVTVLSNPLVWIVLFVSLGLMRLFRRSVSGSVSHG